MLENFGLRVGHYATLKFSFALFLYVILIAPVNTIKCYVGYGQRGLQVGHLILSNIDIPSYLNEGHNWSFLDTNVSSHELLL
jgi:hypothetical protein